jgi:hypothetical protein
MGDTKRPGNLYFRTVLKMGGAQDPEISTLELS